MRYLMIRLASTAILLMLPAFAPWLRIGRPLLGHEGHGAVTYKVTPALRQSVAGSHLRLRILDETGKPAAARFSLTVDGEPFVPTSLGENGLRFVSIHRGKRNTFVATYSRGTGDVIVPLPSKTVGSATRGSVTAAKGFEYHATSESFRIVDGHSDCTVRLTRWADLGEDGWYAADEHVHYERTDPKHDPDWLTMLDADGLAQAFFLVLKGGNVPGVWAQQYAYGPGGEASGGEANHRFIRSGEEYRDSSQGHINLLGISEVIEPISTGGVGSSPRYNYPPLVDVLRQTHRLGGIGGPAHGGALAKSSTALLDTIHGEVDFFEIANSHLYKTDVWYLLMNCGFIIPPVAGTDLPNFGYRDHWQPLLGEVRTYVRMGNQRGFRAWAAALRRGEVFVTSGPLIRFTVNGKGAGSVIRLPRGGGAVEVFAQLQSPRMLGSLEIVRFGESIAQTAEGTAKNGIIKLEIDDTITIKESCWMAARGVGGPKTAIEKGLSIEQNEFAHSGVIQILVGEEPIRSAASIELLRNQIIAQQEYYRTKGRYERSEDRIRFVQLFEDALKRLDP